MKKWFTLIGLCCLMTGMISATNQPLKRITPVQAAQMRLGVLNEGTTRMEETVRPIDTKNIGRILSRSAVSSVTGNSSAFRNAVSADSWLADGNYDISWYDETKDEFSLSSPAQLAGLSYLVRAGKNFQYCTVRLSADIDLSNYKWIPIGTRGVEFKGLFDGGGHTISGLHTDMEVFSGLFGAVASTDIRNVMLSSSCVVVGSVAGSIVGSMSNSAIMNCRSDAAVQGYTAGGLVGNADNSSVLASIFNGCVSKLEAANAWVGSYTATAGSPFGGEETQSFEMTIEADDSSPERLTIGWSSSGYGIVYTLTGFIEDDGCLHISIGEQQLGSYGAYTMMLVRYTDDGIFASGEVVGSLSDDNNTITFSVSPASYLMIALVENDQVIGWLEGYVPPFMAVKNEAQIMTGGIVGTSYNTFLEKCFYGDGCAGDGYNDIGTALPSDELLSDAQVRTMNSAASGIVLSDPFVSSLKMWRPGENGPALIEEDYVQSNWWTSEGNYDVSWYDESRTEFTISTPEQLAGLAYLVNTCHQFWGKTVTLANDIDLAEHLWVPIGRYFISSRRQSQALFAGTFDGGGHTIHNLNVNIKIYSYIDPEVSGLFGLATGVIKNVTLAEDCAVRVTAIGSQFVQVGGLCGVLGGNYITNCHNRAYIEARSLFGNIFAAGILGFDNPYNPVYNCSNANDVVGVSTWGFVYVSGLVAANAKVVNGYNIGNISGTGPSVEVGGIAPSFAQLNNVYNAGRLTATGRSIIPESEPVATAFPIAASYGASVENGYYDIACVEDTTGMNVKGTAMTADEMKSFAFAELLTSHAASLVESDPDLPEMLSWTIRSEENDGFPVFGEAVETGGWWTSAGNYDISWYDEAEDSFSISTPAQLAGVAYLVKNGRTFEGKTVTLTGNIDLDGLKWEPIGKANLQQIFKGVFDGGGYEIHNLRSEVISTGEAYSGLFGAIYQARVTRVVLAEDCEIRTSYYGGGVVAYAQESEIVSCENRASVSFEGPAGYVGGIAGYVVSTSSIDRCENLGIVTGTVQPSDNYASCLVYAGGIAGVNQESTIINNSNHAVVEVDALPEYDSYAGGIVGYNNGSSTAFIANCYNAGGVRLSGSGFAGGILSYTDNADIRVANCYNIGTVSGVPGKSYPVVPILSADSEDCYYLTNCVEGEGSYAGTALTVDYMKSTAFAARLNDWSKTNNSSETGRQTLYWKVEDAENDGYPVFTDQDPGYTGVESVVSGVRIYPTTVSGELFVCGAESPIYIYNLAGHIVSIIDPTEEITVVDMSRLVAGVYLVRTGDKVVRLVKL